MSNIENITSKILKDAEEKKNNILSAAEEEKKKILSDKVNKAKEIEEEIVSKATSEAKVKKERILSSAALKVRNNKLAAKQEVIAEVFVNSVEKLSAISSDEFKSFVKNTILNLTISGDEKIILNEDGKKILDNKFLEDLNATLGNNGKLTISEETRNFKGGFILEKNGIEINNTFEALVEAIRDELEFEVANVLFN